MSKLVFIVAALVLASFTTTAHAAVSTVRISATSALHGSESQKSVTATCPGSRRLVGAGANINNGGGHVVIDEIEPNAGGSIPPTAVTVWALEDEGGTNANWTVTAYAICTHLPFTGHFKYHASSPPLSSNTYQEATASCYGSGHLLGWGFDIGNGDGEVKLYDAQPSSNSVRVAAVEDPDGYSAYWTVTAYAICGFLEDGEFQLLTSSSPLGNDEGATSATVSCSPGFTLLSAGLTTETVWWNSPERNVTVDELRPNGSSVSTPTSATVWELEDPSWFDGGIDNNPWWFDAYATCVDPTP